MTNKDSVPGIELILYDKRIRGLDPYHPVRFEPGEAIPQDTFGYIIVNLRPTSPDVYWFIHNIPRFAGEDVHGTVTYHTAGTRIVMRHGKVTECPSQVVRERIFDVTVYFSEFETVLL